MFDRIDQSPGDTPGLRAADPRRRRDGRTAVMGSCLSQVRSGHVSAASLASGRRSRLSPHVPGAPGVVPGRPGLPAVPGEAAVARWLRLSGLLGDAGLADGEGEVDVRGLWPADLGDRGNDLPWIRTPLSTWFAAIWFLTSQKNGMSALGLQRVLGFGTYETAWAWLQKLRRAGAGRPGPALGCGGTRRGVRW